QRLGFLSPQLRNECRGVGNEGRLTLLAAMRDRREEGRVGLDKHLVGGKPFGRRLEVGCVLEGHNPRQRDVETEVEALARELGRAGEAVEYSGYAPFPARCLEDLGRIGLSLARMDHKREAGLARGFDMRLEALALGRTVGLVVVIIEPALPDRDHARVIGAFDERSRSEVGMSVGLVRVNSYGRPDVGVSLGGRDDVTPLTLAGRNVEEALDAAFPRVFKHFILALDEPVVIEVAMAVDQPHAASSSSSSSLGNKGVGCAMGVPRSPLSIRAISLSA